MSLLDKLAWWKLRRDLREAAPILWPHPPDLSERLAPTTYTINGAELISIDDAEPVHSLFLRDGVWMWRPWPGRPLANTADFCRDDGVWYADAEGALRGMSPEQQRTQVFRLWLLPSALPADTDPNRIWLERWPILNCSE